MKVLIVEDDVPSRNFMKDTVEVHGFETHLAENGVRGLEVFKEINPHLVLSDIQMPEMDGLQLLEEIRRLNSNTIIVMVTAFGCEEYAMKAMELRANNYLKKPVRHAELLPLLKKYSSLIDKPTEPEKPPEIEIKSAFTIKLESDVKKVPSMVDWLVKTAGNQLDESGKLGVKLGLVELLNNAIEHGNLGDSDNPDSLIKSRKVLIVYKTTASFCEWTITDEGNGFDWKTYLEQLAADPLGMEGKGLLCCQFHFTELEFNSTGSSVTARKNRNPELVGVIV
jgi:CheY-like chemotaxis protein